jgi:hypothetical protein
MGAELRRAGAMRHSVRMSFDTAWKGMHRLTVDFRADRNAAIACRRLDFRSDELVRTIRIPYDPHEIVTQSWKRAART